MFNPMLVQYMKEARERCQAIAKSEQLLGYTDSSLTYTAMAGEFSGLSTWVDLYEMDLQNARKAA